MTGRQSELEAYSPLPKTSPLPFLEMLVDSKFVKFWPDRQTNAVTPRNSLNDSPHGHSYRPAANRLDTLKTTQLPAR